MPIALVVRLVFWLWFAGAVLIGYQQTLQSVSSLALPALVFGLTGLLLYGYFRLAALRAWVDALDVRSLVAWHLTRFVGVYFLFLYRQGVLPHDFAVPTGFGDIVVAAFAVGVLSMPAETPGRSRAIAIWNTAGLVELLLFVALAVRFNLAAPLQLRALGQLPLSLLPTLVIPLLLASHVAIYVRLASRPA